MPISTTNVTPTHEREYVVEESVGSSPKGLSKALALGAITAVATLNSTFCNFLYSPRERTDIPTYCSGYLESEGRGYQFPLRTPNDILTNYKYDVPELAEIVSYLYNYPDVQVFLAELYKIIEKIYPGCGTNKKLQLITDPDTSEPLMRLVFDSGLPVDGEFILKEQELFSEIQSAGIGGALNNVVFVNA
ncbi:MAG: hypothetical protein OEL83_01235 [Desulforhopalus sp.]|nr:hypothetical protein [Desulforhopalus sp.]